MTTWTELCPPPRPRPQGVKWDVFISYRSINRFWATALHDTLAQCGHQVFMDQFALVAGQGLDSELGTNLKQSASGVVVWSRHAADSQWVKAEVNSMAAQKNRTAESEFPFHLVIATLDGTEPPGLQDGQIYLDFSEYPDGPMGVEFVRLASGLQGKPLSPDAVASVVNFEEAMREEPAELRTLARFGKFDEIMDRVRGDEPAYSTSALAASIAIEELIRGEKYDAAIEASEITLARFPRSARPKQLQGLALRRAGRLDEAAQVLGLLHERGPCDTETLGMYASVWAEMWAQRKRKGDAKGARDALEFSRDLYEQGFRTDPSNTYTGINAASKSALLGEREKAGTLAQKVLDQLDAAKEKRSGKPPSDYWDRVTEPEALMITGEWERAIELFHSARIAHQHEAGSIRSTATQVERLLGVLDAPEEARLRLAQEFDLQV